VSLFWHNFRHGVLDFTVTYLTISIASLPALIILYGFVNAYVFTIVDVSVLVCVLLGTISLLRFLSLNQPIDPEIATDPEKMIEQM
jgi:hypothetical protein